MPPKSTQRKNAQISSDLHALTYRQPKEVKQTVSRSNGWETNNNRNKMARPIKNSCDYFPHDADMRNHVKVRAIRSKFRTSGYAIWSMFLEYLTGTDGNVCAYTELQFELLSGDFDEESTVIKAVIDYAVKIEMLFVEDGFIYSESLNERLAPVYAKRGKSKEQSQAQKRHNGRYVGKNAVDTVVSVTETPQSKVNKIKVDKSKLDYKKALLSSITIADYPELNSDYISSAQAFRELFSANLTEAGATTANIDKAKGSWIDDIRLIIEADKYTFDDLSGVYAFLQVNEFWKKNILSTSKLREKMDKLKMEGKSNATNRKFGKEATSLNELATIIAAGFQPCDAG